MVPSPKRIRGSVTQGGVRTSLAGRGVGSSVDELQLVGNCSFIHSTFGCGCGWVHMSVHVYTEARAG